MSLRAGNILGKKFIKNSRNNHKLFFDNYLILRKNNKKIIVDNDFKDFLTIIQFSRIVAILIKKKLTEYLMFQYQKRYIYLTY